MTTLGQWLNQCSLPLLEARALLRYATALEAAQQITQSDLVLTPAQHEQLQSGAARRKAGEPLAYLLGEKEFFGMAFHVSPQVLIPRPDTELLVQMALRFLRPMPCARVLELGTGSGCIAVSLALAHRGLDVTAVDVSMDALNVAQSNVLRHGVAARVHCLHSDWFEALPSTPQATRFDLIVANPPYIAQGDTHLDDLRFEPQGALVSGTHGLDALTHIATQASRFLVPRGRLFLEHGYMQAQALRQQLTNAGFTALRTWRDLGGHARVSSGRWCPE